MVLQSSGPISFSDIGREFIPTYTSSTLISFSQLKNIAANGPTNNPVKISQMLGTSASIPTLTTSNNNGTIATINVLTSSSIASGTVNLTVTDQYGAPLTYTFKTIPSQITSTPTFNPSTAVASGTTVTLSYGGIPRNTFASQNLIVNIKNRFGKSIDITIPFNIIGSAPILNSANTFSSLNLTNNAPSYTLSSYFTSPISLSYSFASGGNPQGNAAISNGLLTIYGGYRGMSYTITIIATDSYGQSVSWSISVTEASNIVAPTYLNNLTIYNYPTTTSYLTYPSQPIQFNIAPFFSGTTPLTYSVSTIHTAWSISVDNTGEVTFDPKGSSGGNYITISATNTAGTASYSFIPTVADFGVPNYSGRYMAYDGNTGNMKGYFYLYTNPMLGTGTCIDGAFFITYSVTWNASWSQWTVNGLGAISLYPYSWSGATFRIIISNWIALSYIEPWIGAIWKIS